MKNIDCVRNAGREKKKHKKNDPTEIRDMNRTLFKKFPNLVLMNI